MCIFVMPNITFSASNIIKATITIKMIGIIIVRIVITKVMEVLLISIILMAMVTKIAMRMWTALNTKVCMWVQGKTI